MDNDLRKLMVICWSAIAALAVLLALVAWLAWPAQSPAASRAREYRDYDLCLLTDEHGIQAEPASQVWQGLQSVSLETKSKVSFLRVIGEPTEPTEAVAAQFVATEVQQSCDIIVSVGAPQVAAAAAAAARYPAVRFVTIGAPPAIGAPNLSNVDASGVADHVKPLVR